MGGSDVTSAAKKRIGILVVAYNAATTLAKVLDRIPAEIRSDIEEVIVSDDHSQDSTYLVGLGYQQVSDLPITLIRQPTNLGYGGNQKAGYDLAIEHGLDIVVMLHGDGQYAPESLPDIVAPLLAGEADAVFGSRIMIKGAARRGGMPLYKYVGNRILSRFENAALGTELTEFHSGYRAYSVAALKQLPFERNSDGFNFDTQIIIQLHDAGMRIAEVPIPTYYGDEICYVDGMGYAADVTKDVVAYRLQKAGFGDGSRIALNEEYQLKPSEDSSHGRISTLLKSRPPGKILDLGCSSGLLSERLRAMGHHVTGVDLNEIAGVEGRTDAFYRADLNEGVPPGGGHRVRHRAGRRRARAPCEPGGADAAGPHAAGAGGHGHLLRPQYRPLVPAFPFDTRDVRLRPAGDPRLHPLAVLHPAEHPEADRAPGLHRPTARAGGPAPRCPGRGGGQGAVAAAGGPRAAVLVADDVRIPVHRRGHPEPRVSG